MTIKIKKILIGGKIVKSINSPYTKLEGLRDQGNGGE
jgi:hypothetical protein